jgi:Tfp pilus assembly protein PilE
MQVQSKQTATVLMESLITMLVIAGLLVSINATYTSYTNLISAAKKNLALAECLEESGADGVENASQ